MQIHVQNLLSAEKLKSHNGTELLLCNLTVTLSKYDLWCNVLRSAKHLHVLELRTVLVNGSLIEVRRHYSNQQSTSHHH